jgi:hypothetical protein
MAEFLAVEILRECILGPVSFYPNYFVAWVGQLKVSWDLVFLVTVVKKRGRFTV